MNTQQIAQIIAAVIAQVNAKPKASTHKKLSSYKPANKYQNVKAKTDKVLSEGMTERQLKNDVAVAKAFKKAGFTVVPRVDALTYKGWLLKGMRVTKGQHGIYVKGVGTLFHSGQVAPEPTQSKAEMRAETEQLLQGVA